MAYKRKLETRELFAKASIDYLANDLSISEIERLHNIPRGSFRQYLYETKLIKDCHKLRKTKTRERLKDIQEFNNEIIKDITAFKNSNKALMPTINDTITNYTNNAQELQELFYAKTRLIIDKMSDLIEYHADIDTMYRASQVLKNLNDTLGLFGKAPTIAIQNNLQNNTYTKKPSDLQSADNALNVNLKFIDKLTQDKDLSKDS